MNEAPTSICFPHSLHNPLPSITADCLEETNPSMCPAMVPGCATSDMTETNRPRKTRPAANSWPQHSLCQLAT